MTQTDAELSSLLQQRARLLTQLSRVLQRAGPHHPRRTQINRERALVRKQVRKKLRQNAERIVAHCMHHVYYYTTSSPEHDPCTLSSSAVSSRSSLSASTTSADDSTA